jgi:hypothetical protein
VIVPRLLDVYDRLNGDGEPAAAHSGRGTTSIVDSLR